MPFLIETNKSIKDPLDMGSVITVIVVAMILPSLDLVGS